MKNRPDIPVRTGGVSNINDVKAQLESLLLKAANDFPSYAADPIKRLSRNELVPDRRGAGYVVERLTKQSELLQQAVDVAKNGETDYLRRWAESSQNKHKELSARDMRDLAIRIRNLMEVMDAQNNLQITGRGTE